MNNEKARILVADDEKDIVELLEYNLKKSGFNVITAYNGQEAIEKLIYRPDLILLDVMMPKISGFDVCRQIRKMEEFKNLPILFLTAKTTENEEITGLNIGANDFIRKPVSINKIIARIESHLRPNNRLKMQSIIEKDITLGPLFISIERHFVSLDNKQIDLQLKEFKIVYFLSSNPGKVFTRDKILDKIWGLDVYVTSRTVDVHITGIRKKFGDYGDLIETIKGVGYRFKNII